MNTFKYSLIFFGTLIILITGVNSAPVSLGILLVPRQSVQLEEIPGISRSDSPFFPHVPEDYPSPHPAVGAVQPERSPLNTKSGNKEEITDNGFFIETHPAVVIGLFTFSPFVICLVLYPFLKCHRRRNALARFAKEAASMDKGAQPDEKYPGTPLPPPYWNSPHLESLPAYPQMVYVPPATGDGTRPIFGHFRSPSGEHQFGVTDRWVVASSRECSEEYLEEKKPMESILVHEV